MTMFSMPALGARLLLRSTFPAWLVLAALPSLGRGSVLYSDFSVWSGAVSSGTTAHFDSDQGYHYGIYWVGGAGFGSATGYVSVRGGLGCYLAECLYTDGQLTVTPPGGTTAMGMDLGNAESVGNSILITATLQGGGISTDSFVMPATTSRFWGVTSDVPIATLTLSSDIGGGVNRLFSDAYSFGSTAATPEPASVVLSGTALFLFGVRRRRKGSRKSRPDHREP